ncbi:hypothetical protein KFL_007640010, partial [Klebsormidium nitens]
IRRLRDVSARRNPNGQAAASHSRPATSRQAAPKLRAVALHERPLRTNDVAAVSPTCRWAFCPRTSFGLPVRPDPSLPSQPKLSSAQSRIPPRQPRRKLPRWRRESKKQLHQKTLLRAQPRGPPEHGFCLRAFKSWAPSDDPRRQGVICGPTAPVDTAPALQDADQAPAAAGPPPEPAADNIYDPENPQIGALLGKLPGAYRSDPNAGFHRSPRIDNSGPQLALLVNGRVVPNLILDSGAEAVITGPSGAKAMGITLDMPFAAERL